MVIVAFLVSGLLFLVFGPISDSKSRKQDTKNSVQDAKNNLFYRHTP